jgi:hypothetical protein
MLVKRLTDARLPGGGAGRDCIPGGETHKVKNLGNAVATMLLVMPCPAAAQ